MFESFLRLFADPAEGGAHPSQFGADDYRLAAAALLVHTATIDGRVSGDERDKLHDVIKSRFKLDDEDADALIAKATEAEQEAVDLYRFTSKLNRSLDDVGRARLVEMMWQVVYADGVVTEFEDNLIWRAADLLHVTREERIALRARVAKAATNGGN